MNKRRVTELRIRLRNLQKGDDAETGCAVEASVNQGSFFSLQQPLLWNDIDLQSLESNPWAYGQKLGELLFGDSGLRSALDFANGQSDGHVRMRLDIDEDCKAAQSVVWERAMYRRGSEALMVAADEKVFFSRTVPRANDLPATPGSGKFRLVLAIASPNGLPEEEDSGPRAIDIAQTAKVIVNALRPMMDRGQLQLTLIARVSNEVAKLLRDAGVEVKVGPATLNAISDELPSAHGLHLVCHGFFDSRKARASLLLEDIDGGPGLTGEDAFLARLPARSLRLLFLQSCDSSKRPKESADLWSGLAPKAAKKVAAVIAMQEKVRIDDAERFACVMYSALLQCGEADEAVNAGRRAILKPGGGSWAIPALYLDSREVIWEPDPLVDAVYELAASFGRRQDVSDPFPIDLIRKGGQVSAMTEIGPQGPRVPVLEAITAELKRPSSTGRTLVMVGNFGRAKTAQLYRVYCELAKTAARGEGPLPLFCRLANFPEKDEDAEPAIATAIQAEMSPRSVPSDLISARLSQPVTLLLDADDSAANSFRQFAFSKLEDLLARNPQSSVIVTLDQQNLKGLQTACPKFFSNSAIFFVQLLSQSALYQYLNLNPARSPLYNSISTSNLFDLARVPWLLSNLLRPGASAPKSRAVVVDRISNVRLDEVSREKAIYRMVRQALGETAWLLHTCQKPRVSGQEFQKILREVRGEREVGIEELWSSALKTRVLVQSEEDSVRFAYPGFQSLWCAHFLLSDPDAFKRRLDDITATLGRRSRVTLWDDTLVLLAGLMKDPEILLRRILAGSGLGHGEQIHVACRCIHEVRLANPNRRVPDDILGQVCDNLIRQSHPSSGLTSSERIKAVQALGLLRAEDAIPHLVSIAADRIRRNASGDLEFEYSGVRQAAIGALMSMQQQTQKHLESLAARDATKKQGMALCALIHSWRSEKFDNLRALAESEDCLAPLSALILGTIGGIENLKFLADLVVAESTGSQKIWAIADALLQFHPTDVTEIAVSRMRQIPGLAMQCAYLIGRLGVAAPDSAEADFLRNCLLSPDLKTRGVALRSLAQLGVDEYRGLCEHIVAEDWKAASKVLKNTSFSVDGAQHYDLIFYALESLKLIGGADSIDALREARKKNRMRDPGSRLPDWVIDLSYQTGEEIYWRLTGGLEGDSFGPPSAKREGV